MRAAKDDRSDNARWHGRISGLYGLADAEASGGDPERLAAAWLDGGCRLLQLRCKDWLHDDIVAVARAVRRRCDAVGAVFIVNDDALAAARVDADGVHVGQLDAATDAVRAIVGPNRCIGRSTNALDQLPPAARGADYVAFGPVWATDNAGRDKGVRGLEALREARRQVDVPLVAIGGIDASRVAAVRAAGADAWAVIGAVAFAPDPRAAVADLLAR